MNIVLRSAFACISFLSVQAGAASIAVQVRDGAGAALADVVLYAEPEPGVALPHVDKMAEIAQRKQNFIPLVTVVQTGSRIAFPNYDKVRHHIYSFSPAKRFDQKLYSGAAAAVQVFDKPGTVVLGCNIHDSMIAYVKVVDTPFFAKSDAAGSARIDLPGPGKYTIKAWHFNMAGAGAEQVVAVKAGQTDLSFSLALKPPAAEAGAR